MFEIWDIKGVARPYDWQAAQPVRRTRGADAFDTTEQQAELGVDHRSARPRADPYRRAIERQAPPPERRRVREARQLMSAPVIHLHPEDTIGEAWDVVRERRFRHLPVIDENGRMVGIISDRDLLRVAGTPDHQPRSDVSGRAVRTLMHTEVYSARPDTPIRTVAQVLFERRIGAMPIVDPSGSLLGMLTRTDILRALVNEAPLEMWI